MTEKTYIVDRVEDGIAVIECQDTYEYIKLPKSELPKAAREGHVLTKFGEMYTIDRDATQKRRDALKSRLEKILGRAVK